MDAYISGWAGRAVMVEGLEAVLLEAERPDVAAPISRDGLHMLLGDAVDLLVLRNTGHAAVRCRLERDYKRETALRIFQIALNEDDPEELADILVTLNDVLKESDRRDYVCNHMLAIDLVDDDALVFRSKAYRSYPFVASAFDQFFKFRENVGHVRHAWTKEFATNLDFHQRDQAEIKAVYGGVFSSFVLALTVSAQPG